MGASYDRTWKCLSLDALTECQSQCKSPCSTVKLPLHTELYSKAQSWHWCRAIWSIARAGNDISMGSVTIRKRRGQLYIKTIGFWVCYGELFFLGGWCSGSTLAPSKRNRHLLDTPPLKFSAPYWKVHLQIWLFEAGISRIDRKGIWIWF